MQDSVSFENLKKRKRINVFSVFILIIIVIMVLIFGTALYLKNKQNNVFEQQSFYYLCAEKSKSIKDLESLKDSVKTLGGAGNIYAKDSFYYLVINVYLDKDYAMEVLHANRTIYPNAELIEVSTKKISRKSKILLRNYDVAIEFLKLFNKAINEISTSILEYLSSSITENNLCSKILLSKFEFDDLSLKIDGIANQEVKLMVKNYINLAIMYYSSFFNSFFDSDKKSSVVCEFMTNITFLKIDFFNNL